MKKFFKDLIFIIKTTIFVIKHKKNLMNDLAQFQQLITQITNATTELGTLIQGLQATAANAGALDAADHTTLFNSLQAAASGLSALVPAPPAPAPAAAPAPESPTAASATDTTTEAPAAPTA